LRRNLQTTIRTQFPGYDRLVHPTPPSVQSLAQQLEPAQALLLALPTADAVYVWAVAKDRPARFARVPLPQEQLHQMVDRLRSQLDFSKMQTAPKLYDSEVAYALYDKILAPVAPVWQGKPQLIVATGGALSQLPFAVLHTAAGGGADAKAPWLIAQTSITQVPSLSAWVAIKGMTKARPAQEAFLGWGDPIFSAPASQTIPAKAQPAARSLALQRGKSLVDSDTDLSAPTQAALRYADMPALPDTRTELQAIAKILSANTTDVIVGLRATRESVLSASLNGILARKRVVAFATHGLMAGDLPYLHQPALAMSVGSSTEPLAPLLTLEDVLTLKLNADWVVLSACNTGAADGKAEEALSGLARGFFYAGGRSLLVTHWSVESESATLLTTATFEHYVNNPQAPKAESLRQAMLKVMAMPKYGHPAYWAPYALVGDGGR
jgi:CHAT domain-containing protein